MTRYTLFGGELSLFTRKLEAALIFYGADFDFQPKMAENAAQLESRSGTHQVPVLQTPENWMIGDTTPIMAMLDGRYPARAMFPTGAIGALVHILEEFLDEWVARVMVHYRWHYPESAAFAANKIALGDADRAANIAAWGPRACRATGTASEHQQQAAEQEYQRLLAAAESQLQQTAYLLGERPTAVDCMFLGGLRAHTNMDPDPKKVVANYPTVVAWAEQLADQWRGDGDLMDLPGSEFAQQMASEMASTYVPYITANQSALSVGAKAFNADIYGEEVSYLTRPYPEQSRQMISHRLAHLPAGERTELDAWLRNYGLDQTFT